MTDVQMDLVRKYGASKTNAEIRAMFGETAQPAPSQPAAPVELPVVAWLKGDASSGDVFLVKLSDAQAAIAAGRKAS